MSKTNLIKIISIILISAMVVLFSTNVLAADDEVTDLSGTLNASKNNTSNSSNTSNNASSNNASSNNASSNKSNTNTSSNKSNTNNSSNNANSSVYNNSNLPKTGIEDSIPTLLLVVVFGVSAVYAYKKISDYKNI